MPEPSSGLVQHAFFRICVKAAVSGITVPHLDYADTLTFTIVATYRGPGLCYNESVLTVSSHFLV